MVQSLFKKLTPGFKNLMRNLGSSRHVVESPKSWNSMGYYFCPKNTFLQLKHIQGIYPTLLSTTCVKIHQIPYVIFEIVTYFPWHNSSGFFSSNIIYFLQKQSIKVQIFRFSTAHIKVHPISHVFLEPRVFSHFHEK